MGNNSFSLESVCKANDPVGVFFDGKAIKLYHPAFFRIEEDKVQQRKDILLLLSSLNISKSQQEQSADYEIGGSIWPIESFMWILRDYIENGLYYNYDKVITNSKNGKVEWKKTFKNPPIISGRNIVYSNLITSKREPCNDSITKVYMGCLKESVDKIGWLFNYNINLVVEPLFSSKEMIQIVSKEMSYTFDDVKRLRFKHLVKILEYLECTKNEGKHFNYTVNNYYYVFETMVNKILKGISNDSKKKYLASGVWRLNGMDELRASSLVPDTVFETDDKIYIIDAKMYQYGSTHDKNDLPNTSSIQKQVVYGDYAMCNFGVDRKIRNSFIMPYDKALDAFVKDKNKEYVLEGDIVYIGEASISWDRTDGKQDHERIFTFLIDFNFLLRQYNTINSTSIYKICAKIEELLNVQKYNEN